MGLHVHACRSQRGGLFFRENENNLPEYPPTRKCYGFIPPVSSTNWIWKSVTPTLKATFLLSWRCMIHQKDHWVLSFLAGLKRIYTTKISHNELAKSCDRSTTIYWVQATPFNKRGGTINITACVWFCVLFVVNATTLPPFDSLSQIDYVLEGEDAMFKYLVVNILKCPILQEFYVNGFLTTPN